MKKYLFALSLGFGGVIWVTQHAEAQSANCAERATIVKRLHEDYGETRQSAGVGRNNAVVEVFVSRETGTWTILVSLPNGTSCLVASGESWEHMANHRLAPGSDV